MHCLALPDRAAFNFAPFGDEQDIDFPLHPLLAKSLPEPPQEVHQGGGIRQPLALNSAPIHRHPIRVMQLIP
jgi:hypothetical protein